MRIKQREAKGEKVYQDFLKTQNHRCAGCFHIEDPNRRLALDHDHGTGITRGLLCRNCNLALGLIKDDVVTLQRLIQYLTGQTIKIPVRPRRAWKWKKGVVDGFLSQVTCAGFKSQDLKRLLMKEGLTLDRAVGSYLRTLGWDRKTQRFGSVVCKVWLEDRNKATHA
jgi:hypothetical protein